MRLRILLPGAALAFLVGVAIAGADAKWAKLSDELTRREDTLFKDLHKIEHGRRDLLDIRKEISEGFKLNAYEHKMDRTAREDIHIFMERYRNDTLETLDLLDRALGKKATDPVRAVFGKALDQVVTVQWKDRYLSEIAADIANGYHVKLKVPDDVGTRQTMSLYGNYSLKAILRQIETVYSVKLVPTKDGGLEFQANG